jgi:hypothetical protein
MCSRRPVLTNGNGPLSNWSVPWAQGTRTRSEGSRTPTNGTGSLTSGRRTPTHGTRKPTSGIGNWLQDSAPARLQAQVETMPVIEQAKGMIMEQSECTPEQAFDLLREASQRSNVPVRELAIRVVRRHRQPEPGPRPHDPRSQHRRHKNHRVQKIVPAACPIRPVTTSTSRSLPVQCRPPELTGRRARAAVIGLALAEGAG